MTNIIFVLTQFRSFVEVFLNTDDPVPTTNEPLSVAVNYDVTKSASKNGFTPGPGDSMHSWPGSLVTYFLLMQYSNQLYLKFYI